jgi:asparagine N-glycosylation enzyme membrane subunit Stt3
MRRLRAGERLAAAGAVVLVVTILLPWFGGRSGLEALGWPVVLLVLADVLLALWLVAATAAPHRLAQSVAAAVVLSAAGTVVALVLVLRVLAFAPSGGLRVAAWLGLGGAVAVVAGAWRAIADERTDAPESAVVPPPARPAPPA